VAGGGRSSGPGDDWAVEASGVTAGFFAGAPLCPRRTTKSRARRGRKGTGSQRGRQGALRRMRGRREAGRPAVRKAGLFGALVVELAEEMKRVMLLEPAQNSAPEHSATPRGWCGALKVLVASCESTCRRVAQPSDLGA